MIKGRRWKDEDILRWANHYIVIGTPLMRMEVELGVSHSTLWWCFIHRLPDIDTTVYQEVMDRIRINLKNKNRRTK